MGNLKIFTHQQRFLPFTKVIPSEKQKQTTTSRKVTNPPTQEVAVTVFRIFSRLFVINGNSQVAEEKQIKK